ncbi:MAG: mechanosensitive ion channel [Calditrichaeota bacterium]|nr:mechanosensitive ion channel [Calditrichota bacterium]MCB9366296.1 mechanosensitive ion channel [Calditrichota bacterium]
MQRQLLLLLILLSVAVCAIAESDSASSARDLSALNGPPPPVKGSPVVFRGDTLLILYASVGPFGPDVRAASITQRLEQSVSVAGELPNLTLQNGDGYSELSFRDNRIGLIVQDDARPTGRTPAQLAAEFSEAVLLTYSTKSVVAIPQITLREVLWALVVTALLIFVIRVANAIYPRLVRAIVLLRRRGVGSFRIFNVELVSSERAIDVVYWLLRSARIIGMLFLLLVYVLTVLSLFPGTASIVTRVMNYAREPIAQLFSAILDYVPNAIALAVIGGALFLSVRLLRRFAMEVEAERLPLPGFYADWAIPTFKMVRALLLLLALVIAYPLLPGSSSPAFKAVSVFIGVLLSLGSTSAVSNVIAGIVLTYMRPFKVGDRVKIADTLGDVVEKTLLVTRIMTLKLEDVTIPNSAILGNHIVNYSSTERSDGVLLHTSVTIGYDAPWRKVYELLISAASETDGISGFPKPFVLQKALNDFSVEYELNAHTRHPERMMELYSSLHGAVQDKFNQAGIEIMSPMYAALRDGNRITLPNESLPKGYEAPPFGVKTK